MPFPEDAGAQAELCFANIAAILGEAGLGLTDIVRINAYVTDRAHLRPYMDVRDRLFADPAPASTLMIVSGFARPEFKVEIEVIAAGSRQAVPVWKAAAASAAGLLRQRLARSPGQFGPTPRKPTPRRGGSSVSAGRADDGPGPLSRPRQIAWLAR